MKYLIFRNHTVEHLFRHLSAEYNGYGDLSISTKDADVIMWFFLPPPNSDSGKLLQEIESYKGQLEMLINANPDKRFIVFTLSPRMTRSFEENNIKVNQKILDHNNFLFDLSKNSPRIQFLQIDDFLNEYSGNQIFSWKYFLTSQIIIAPTLTRAFKKWFSQKTRVLSNKRKKCIVLDLDNTLWGGVLGEDGISGIQIGDVYPGLAFRTFQEQLQEAKNNGVILAVCSKNNLEDVLEAFAKNPYMRLKENDFSCVRANWLNKAENIQSIAQELNIGIDSLVFIDDNPVEREIVKQVLPEVEVPEFPDNPYDLPAFFTKVWDEHFKIFELTNEDRSKTEQYNENRKRTEEKRRFVNFDDYLGSLEMVLYPKEADEFSAVRVAQMTQKTNQFNLTTRRYEVSDIQSFIDENHLVFHMAVSDKFGDSGITLLSIVKIEGDQAEIDVLLLSCRILGRGIEGEFLKLLLNQLMKRNVKRVNSSYLPTKKNGQTKDFFEKMGFEVIEEKPDGGKKYKLELVKSFELSKLYKVEL